eukprot:245822-Pyramimonas_sp.AAC.1
MKRSWQGLGEHVSTIVLGVHMEELDGPLSNPVANQVVADVNVFRPRVIDVVLGDETSADVVN